MRTEKYQNLKNIERSKIKLAVILVLLFIILLSSIFIFSGLSPQQVVLAITGNYSKTSGQQLTTTDWNNLPNDFVAKSGDTMSGNLNMGAHGITNLANPITDTDAVNRGSMNSAISAAQSTAGAQIKDLNGSNLKMVCGSTIPGATAWQNYMAGVYVDIDLSAAGFTPGSVPYIFTSIGGTGNQAYTRGATSIYTQGTAPFTSLSSGFRVYVFNDSGLFEPWSTYQWYINWCALGY